MSRDLPCSGACLRNAEPILGVLRRHFADRIRVLEIGSGTGQHAEYFATKLPHLTWQASDRDEYLPGIGLRLERAGLPNTPAPLPFDVNDDEWPPGVYDAVFSANTLHIMSWSDVEHLFGGLPSLLAAEATVAVYGPFNYGGRFTSPSNAAFDVSLKATAPHRGIRDSEAVNALAENSGLHLVDDISMPANNRCLVWRRS